MCALVSKTSTLMYSVQSVSICVALSNIESYRVSVARVDVRVRSPGGARVVQLLCTLLVRQRVRRQQSLCITGAVQCHELPHLFTAKCDI